MSHHHALLATAALLLSGVLVAGCTGSPASPASRATKSPAKSAPAAAAAGNCLLPPGSSCYAPRQFRVAYGIQPVLDQGIDGRAETVTVLALPPLANSVNPSPSAPAAGSASAAAAPPPGAQPANADIRQALAAFDRLARLPAARIRTVTALAGSASRQANAEEIQDAQHALGFVNPAVYRIARSSRYHRAFHDVTTGTT